jgi:hypothetical protein
MKIASISRWLARIPARFVLEGGRTAFLASPTKHAAPANLTIAAAVPPLTGTSGHSSSVEELFRAVNTEEGVPTLPVVTGGRHRDS